MLKLYLRSGLFPRICLKVTNLPPVVICKVHDFLWCPRAFDGHGGKGENCIATRKLLHVLKCVFHTGGRVVAGNFGVGCSQSLRKTLNLLKAQLQITLF